MTNAIAKQNLPVLLTPQEGFELSHYSLGDSIGYGYIESFVLQIYFFFYSSINLLFTSTSFHCAGQCEDPKFTPGGRVASALLFCKVSSPQRNLFFLCLRVNYVANRLWVFYTGGRVWWTPDLPQGGHRADPRDRNGGILLLQILRGAGDGRRIHRDDRLPRACWRADGGLAAYAQWRAAAELGLRGGGSGGGGCLGGSCTAGHTLKFMTLLSSNPLMVTDFRIVLDAF